MAAAGVAALLDGKIMQEACSLRKAVGVAEMEPGQQEGKAAAAAVPILMALLLQPLLWAQLIPMAVFKYLPALYPWQLSRHQPPLFAREIPSLLPTKAPPALPSPPGH